jgi:CDP-6-deoxy-D-xylo-4-hexulose-3-dehydrase
MIKYAEQNFDSQEKKYLQDACDKMWLTHGEWCVRFEKEFSQFLGMDNSLFVNSGSSANLLAFMALTSPLLGKYRINRGDTVITTASCFPTMIAPIMQYGAMPIFVDIDIDTLNIDISLLLEKYLLDKKPKAIILSHTLGNPFDIEKVMEFAKKHSIWVIEDNCDALGARYKGQYTGTFGHIGTSSFYAAHHISTGEGGMVYTDNDILYKIMLSMRDWGRECTCLSGIDNRCGQRFSKKYKNLPDGYDHKYIYSHFGYNLKATEMQAAIGCAQLEKVKSFISQRKWNFRYLFDNLKHLDKYFIFPGMERFADPSPFAFWLTVKDKFLRNEITAYLEKNGIQTRNLFAGNILRQPCFEEMANDLKLNIDNLPNTDYVMNNTFFVGCHPKMSQDDLDKIIKTIEEFVCLKKY